MMSHVRSAASLPVLGNLGKRIWYTFLRPFPGSFDYWESRYQQKGTSGAGSYGRLAQFKADVLNRFVRDNKVTSLIEFGCGDGNQLSLADYPSYLGLDVSSTAIQWCKKRFQGDATKQFAVIPPDDTDGNAKLHEVADLALSLDVIFHLVEDAIFETYMNQLFRSARRFVVIYSSNDERPSASPHVRHRRFTRWIEDTVVGWKLHRRVANPFPYDEQRRDDTSPCDFFVYARKHNDIRDEWEPLDSIPYTTSLEAPHDGLTADPRS